MARTDEDRSRRGRTNRRRSAGGNVRRALGLLALAPAAGRAPQYGRLAWNLIRDERTPAARTAILGGALAYVVLGRDLIPDDVPVLGGLDDLVVVALALDLFVDGIDREILAEHLAILGIDGALFDDDIARLRRFLPGPLRRTVRRLPGLVAAAGEALQQSGLGPRLRGWINQEGARA